MVRDENDGAAIAVEVWELPRRSWARCWRPFPPLQGLEQVELSDGRWLSGFICAKGTRSAEATDITGYGEAGELADPQWLTRGLCA